MPVRATYIAIAIAAWILGAAWAVSSPEGSSPDDNFHLPSIWCATGNADACIATDTEPPGLSAQVPEQLLNGECFWFKSDISGACADIPDDTIGDSNYFNTGLYPPTFYAPMSLFVGPDIWRSVVVMRLVALTVSLAVLALAMWAAPGLRRSQVVAWSVASIPLWMFIVPSTNPSSWAVAGVAAMWPAAYGMMQAANRRALAIAAVAVVFAALLATSRGDSAAMALAVLGLVTVLYVRSKAQLLAVAVALVVGVVLLLVFLSSSQTESLAVGLPGEKLGSGISLLWANILNLPDLWVGAFGARFSLGWFDTFIPSLAWFPAMATASALVVLGIARLGLRKGLLLAGVGALLVVLPLLMLQLSGAPVGGQVQPRYLLPLIVVFIGVALAPLDQEEIALTAPQRWALTVACTLATSLALHTQMRRWITGLDVSSPNLNAGAEWWGLEWLSPMVVWLLGTAAAAVLFVAVFGLLARGRLDRREKAVGSPSELPVA